MTEQPLLALRRMLLICCIEGGEKMRKDASVLLDTNDVFPEMDLNLVSGGTLSLPEGTGKGYGIVLLYRGSW